MFRPGDQIGPYTLVDKLGKGAGVALGFSNGVTDSVYTDSDGEAVIEHSTTGNATIFVNGQDKGSMNTPGRKLVFI